MSRDVASRSRLMPADADVVGLSDMETVAEFRARRRRIIAANIRRLRVEAGISQEDLAGRLGLRRTDYWRYEAGRREPVQHLDDIARELGVEVGDLTGNHADDEAA